MRLFAASLFAILFFCRSAIGHTPSKRVGREDGLSRSLAATANEANWQFETGLTLLESSKFDEAARWFSKAASHGHRLAQCNLGALYARGLGVAKDVHKAMRWYRLAAEQGDEMAMYNIGALYANEEHDMGLAVEWFQKSAAQGYPAAQANLGMMYWRGEGVERNPALAQHWLLMAGEQQDAAALFSLGWIALQSPESPPDRVLAFAYFSLSAVYGNESALAARQQLEATMSALQIREGQKLAREWKAGGIPPRARDED
jgi:uncharacterized protein